MRNIGCFVRYKYRSQTNTSETDFNGKYPTSIACATACYENASCLEGWSYQIATEKCFFRKKVDPEKLQPGTLIQKDETKIGWVTGLKSCSIIRM